MKTYLHLKGGGPAVETHEFWGGCSLIDHAGRLYVVDYAVNDTARNETHVYAHPLSRELDKDHREWFENWEVLDARDETPKQKEFEVED